MNGNVYDEKGLSPTLTTNKGEGIKIKQVGNIVNNTATYGGNPQRGRIYSPSGLCPTLNCVGGGGLEPKIIQPTIQIKEATKRGYDIACMGDSINFAQPNSKTRRGRVGKNIANTLTTSCEQGVLNQDFRIRKLTPLECWRLQGFNDEDVEKAKQVGISDAQLYKQAGNSVTVNVVEYLANLIMERGLENEK